MLELAKAIVFEVAYSYWAHLCEPVPGREAYGRYYLRKGKQK